jgi:hypothetical protein
MLVLNVFFLTLKSSCRLSTSQLHNFFTFFWLIGYCSMSLCNPWWNSLTSSVQSLIRSSYWFRKIDYLPIVNLEWQAIDFSRRASEGLIARLLLLEARLCLILLRACTSVKFIELLSFLLVSRNLDSCLLFKFSCVRLFATIISQWICFTSSAVNNLLPYPTFWLFRKSSVF